MECRSSIKVLHIKSLLPCVKSDVLYFLNRILMNFGIWMCNVVERGMKGVHSEFY